MPLFNKISTEDKKDFIGALALLIKSGTPINEAFELLSKQTRSPILKKVFKKAQERTEKGTPIYQVFEEDKNFELVFSSFIRAGEESGSLDKSLDFLATWLDKKNSLEREISSATLYPKIVLVFALLLGSGLAFFVLPKLTLIFASLNTELPLTSRILLSSANFIQEHGLALLLGIVAVLVLFNSGLMITKILEIASESTSNYAYKKSLEHIKQRITRGDSFSSAINDFPRLYPDIYSNILTTGETTGSFERSFAYLAEFFLSTLTEKTKQLPVILEPVILIIIGVFVAFVASAIILPIYQVTQGFR